jgi:hypothetical protein
LKTMEIGIVLFLTKKYEMHLSRKPCHWPVKHMFMF